MHPIQAKLLAETKQLLEKTAAAVLWKYSDPEGQDFYLSNRQTTIHSPYSGKTFTAKPEKFPLSEVSKELKEDAAAAKAEKTAETIEKTAAPILWKYTDQDGKDFWLPARHTTIRSPYTGKTFSAKPEKSPLFEVSKELKEDTKTAARSMDKSSIAKRLDALAKQLLDVRVEVREVASLMQDVYEDGMGLSGIPFELGKEAKEVNRALRTIDNELVAFRAIEGLSAKIKKLP